MSMWIFHFPSEYNQVTDVVTFESGAICEEQMTFKPWGAEVLCCSAFQQIPKKKKTPYECSAHAFGFRLHVPWQRSAQVWSSRRGVLLSARDWSGRHPATVSHQWGRLKTMWVSTMLYYPTEASVLTSTTRPVLQSHRQVATCVIMSLGEKCHYPAPVFHFSL